MNLTKTSIFAPVALVFYVPLDQSPQGNYPLFCFIAILSSALPSALLSSLSCTPRLCPHPSSAAHKPSTQQPFNLPSPVYSATRTVGIIPMQYKSLASLSSSRPVPCLSHYFERHYAAHAILIHPPSAKMPKKQKSSKVVDRPSRSLCLKVSCINKRNKRYVYYSRARSEW